MRRTLVSRKARKKRIAENAEMNGENFYSRQNTIQTGARAESPPPLNSSAPPMVNGAPGSDRLPTFTTYEKSAAVIEEDRVPLNTRTPSNKTLPNTSAQARPSKDGSEKYGGLPRGGPRGMRGGRGGFSGPRDEFGNPLPPSNAFGPNRGQMRRDPSDPRLRRQYSDENISAQGFRERGRGGYPGRGYGRGAPYGPGRPVMNGGHRGMQMRPLPAVAGGGMVANNMRNRGQEPPPDYGNGYPPNGIDRLGQYESDMPQQGPSGYGRSQSATGFGRRSPGSSSAPYGRQYSPAPASAPGGYGRQPSPGIPSAPDVYARQRSNSSPKAHGYVERQLSPDFYQAQRFRQESPPPPMPEIPANDSVIGQAVEMDARTGSPARAPHFAKPLQLRDSDSDVQGLVGLQQQREHRESPMSLTSVYSSQESYVPPRSGWGNNTTRTTTAPSNNLAPVQDSPVELPTHTSQSPPSQPNIRSPSHARYNSAENYYEDVDPRFAEPTLDHNNHSNAPLPSALTAGRQPGTNGFQPLPQPEGGNHHLQPNVSYESVEDAGKQSPAVSDGSNYTSISQRGINPQWNPLQAQGQGMSMGGIPNRRPVVQQRDLLLSSNPDFELPIQGPGRGERMGVGRGERRAPGMAAGTDHGGPTSTYPGGAF
ncbi:MAG: hypothetical protein LQ342_001119 [Letrouitia transgressa]|nr:MAG: hypothetical protein LQ342_001119 [Letrouitia transgressa]